MKKKLIEKILYAIIAALTAFLTTSCANSVKANPEMFTQILTL